MGGRGLGGGIPLQWTDTCADQQNTIVNEGYSVFDAGIHCRQPKGIDLALNVKNITDRATSGGCQHTRTGAVGYRW